MEATGDTSIATFEVAAAAITIPRAKLKAYSSEEFKTAKADFYALFECYKDLAVPLLAEDSDDEDDSRGPKVSVSAEGIGRRVIAICNRLYAWRRRTTRALVADDGDSSCFFAA